MPCPLLPLILLCLTLLQGPSELLPEDDLPRAAPSAGTDQIAANVDLAWDYAHGGDVEKALGLLDQWTMGNPDEPEYPFTKGALLHQEQRYPEALNALMQALEAGATGSTALWARLYAADICLIQNINPRAQALLGEALQEPDPSPRALTFAANIRLRLRIRVELSEVNQYGDFTFYLPPYLIPAEERLELFKAMEEDWQASLWFLKLDPSLPPPIIYLYPSDRLLEKYEPRGVDRTAAYYSHHEVHLLVHQDRDNLPDLAPYAFYQLGQKIHRPGPYYIPVIGGLDEAVRNATESSVPLGAFCAALQREQRMPSIESLCDLRNLPRVPREVLEPATGLLMRFLSERLPQKEFHEVLTASSFLAQLPRPPASWQADFDTYLSNQDDLLTDPAALDAALESIPTFAPLPIIAPQLLAELETATELMEAGDRESALAKVDEILATEPRYGEARYLKAKDDYDRGQYAMAQLEFERVLMDTAPPSAALSFSHFYLGRIAKLSRDYPTASWHYQTALAYGLPPERAPEAAHFVSAIERFLALAPDTAAPSARNPVGFFYDLDQALNTLGWSALAPYLSPNADPQRMRQLALFYDNPQALAVGTAWRHTVRTASDRERDQLLVEVQVDRITADGRVALGWIPEVRRFHLVLTNVGTLFLDYADEGDIFRASGGSPEARLP